MHTRLRVAIQSKQFTKRGLHYVVGNLLHRLPEPLKRTLFSGDHYRCPICETSLKTYLRLNREYHRYCPVCRSLQRHRLLWLFLERKTDICAQGNKRVLHIAPEPGIEKKLRSMEHHQYISGDLQANRAMEKLDICNLHYPPESFDIILCSHVLEHVSDDHKAMQEFHRVLKTDGWIVLLVPIVGDTTIESPPTSSAIEREKLHGQFDHFRTYGLDFLDRLSANGFLPQLHYTEDIASEPEIELYGLNRREPIFYCRKQI
jgi:hypothetical protein